jgi:hypothetical protein
MSGKQLKGVASSTTPSSSQGKQFDPFDIFVGLPPLMCGVCPDKKIEPTRDVCILECGYHAGCSMACSTLPCVHCKCDRCNKFMQTDVVSIKCGCRYHKKCVPFDELFAWGCYLCEKVNKPADEIEGENFAKIKKRQQIKDNFFFEEKMIRKKWRYANLLELKYYRGNVIVGKVPHERWKNYDLDVAAFKNLGVDIYDMATFYFMQMSKAEVISMTKLYPQVSFALLWEACIQNFVNNGYSPTNEEVMRHFKEIKKFTATEMMDLASISKGSIKHVPKEDWDSHYPEVYTKLQQANTKSKS